MNRVLLVIGGLLVGLLATLFVAPVMVDWNRYRGIFEEEATRFLGREVRVGGQVNLRLLPVPFVRFERVRVADTTASVGRPLFMADDFTVWLSVGALLSGGLEASDIEVRRPTVTLVLDGKGGGNWSSLSPENFRGSFVPARVVFDAVRISDGTLDILGPDGAAKTSFQNINGELSAQALEGPYRVAAAFAIGGAAREIRLSTAKPTQDGSVRFKGTVRAPESGVSYSLEGDATDVLSSIKVAGELTARLPLPASLAAKPQSGELLGGGAPKAAGEFDLRAALKGDTKGFALSDLALSFEQEGRPQLATGGANVTWAEQTDVSVTINSHWLDLDKIAGVGTGGSPLELAQGVAVAVSNILATEGRTEAVLTIDQATLGGDVVSNLAATLEHAKGRLNIKSLTAGLPGGARLVTSGTFEGTPPDLRYGGRINLRGASLARFSGWLARDRKLALPARDGPFTIVGDMTIGSREVAGRNLTLEVGRNTLTGDASWKAGQPQQIALNLDGSELDLTPLVPDGADPAQTLRDIIVGLAGGKGRTAVEVDAANADIRLRLDRLVVGPAVFRDAAAELRLAGGNLTMPHLRLASADGYTVELKGDIADLAQATAKGALTGLVTADSAAGLTAVAKLAGLPADFIPASDDAAILTPMRLAGRLQVGLKGPETRDLSLDGLLAQSRIAGSLRLGKSQAGWRDRPTDIALTIEGEAVQRVVAKVVGGGSSTGPGGAAQSGLRLTLRGIGSPKTGMATLAVLDGDGQSAAYRGRVLVDDETSLGLKGEVELALTDLARGLPLGGGAIRTGLKGPVSGTVQVERNGGRMTLATAGLKIAGIEASGEVAVEAKGEAHSVTGDLKLDKGSLQGLFAMLTSGRSVDRAEGDQRSPWSEAPLDLGLAERFAGSRVQLQVGRLALAPGLDVSEARLRARSPPGRTRCPARRCQGARRADVRRDRHGEGPGGRSSGRRGDDHRAQARENGAGRTTGKWRLVDQCQAAEHGAVAAWPRGCARGRRRDPAFAGSAQPMGTDSRSDCRRGHPGSAGRDSSGCVAGSARACREITGNRHRLRARAHNGGGWRASVATAGRDGSARPTDRARRGRSRPHARGWRMAAGTAQLASAGRRSGEARSAGGYGELYRATVCAHDARAEARDGGSGARGGGAQGRARGTRAGAPAQARRGSRQGRGAAPGIGAQGGRAAIGRAPAAGGHSAGASRRGSGTPATAAARRWVHAASFERGGRRPGRPRFGAARRGATAGGAGATRSSAAVGGGARTATATGGGQRSRKK